MEQAVASYEPGDPVATAEAFAAEWTARNVRLDFSLASLETAVEPLLVLLSATRERGRPVTVEQDRAEAALAAYIGESLCRLFDGKWEGEFFSDSTGMNFYRSFIRFGDYRFTPHIFIAYRLTNGESEGQFGAFLKAAVPRIRARQERGKYGSWMCDA